MRRNAPRPLGHALGELTERLQPAGLLAEVQRAWPAAVGAAIAREAEPTGERDGVVAITCSSSVWAAELDLMSLDLIARLTEAVGTGRIVALRCRAAPTRGPASAR